MKNLWQKLFGNSHREAHINSASPRSAEDIRLDWILKRYLEITLEKYPDPKHEDFPHITADWPIPSADYRFLLVSMPAEYSMSGTDCLGDQSFCYNYGKFMRFPLASTMSSAGGFQSYCQGQIFAAFIKDKVIEWQLDAVAWNNQKHSLPRHDEEVINNPIIRIYLLDDPTVPTLVLALKWTLTIPPQTPLPPKLIQPPSPSSGLAKVKTLRLHR